ncbi:MAG: hypothetical protein F4226_04060 [Synechococcus sp. SB0678_bin_12]|nr:hypothetical protein [Synechococcus sp. SB0678_bin_12]MYI87658.1 hypothetical protein [Synechococcus sp. SB0672_bin_10]
MTLHESIYHYALVIEHDRDRRRMRIIKELSTHNDQLIFDFRDGNAQLYHDDYSQVRQWNSESHGIRSRLGLLELLKAMYWDRSFVDFNPYGLPLLPIPILLLINLRGISIHPRGWAATTWIPLLSSSFIMGLWLSFLKESLGNGVFTAARESE